MTSLSALSHVTITGKAAVQFWSDRHCPELETTAMNGFSTTAPIQVCKDYKDDLLSAEDKLRVEELTGNTGDDFFGRDGGARFLLSIAAEIAVRQHWSIYGIFEGVPFGNERALFTDPFAGPMFDTDYMLYLRLGTTYKF